MNGFFAALQFLTVLPLPPSLVRGNDADSLGRSLPYFPLVGLLLGVLVAGADLVFQILFAPTVAAVLSLLLLTALTGGLHLDGLADTADGFFSARPRERMLEIMRDSRTGVMGVLAIVFALALKAAALLSLPGSLRLAVLLLMPMAGRCALTWMMASLSYARQEGGMASAFLSTRNRAIPIASFALLLGAGALLARWAGGGASVAAFGAALAVTGYVRAKIGGFTGDTLGAASELGEVVFSLACVAWVTLGLPR